ncbi:MAG: hypothetical protein [Olavius algarvensis Delta 4 endosymbiont]|nr:MAG: hypothetical protein [Olavius algarvensis Delta 4 endosymbiont]
MLQIKACLGKMGGHPGKGVTRQKLPVSAVIAREVAPRKDQLCRRRCQPE